MRYWRYLRRQPLGWLLLCCAVGAVAMAEEEPTDLQLRVAWGGGVARRWQGALKVQEGSVSDVQFLGLDADEAATIYIERDAVMVRQLADRDYDGFDVRVKAKISSLLKFELAPRDHPEETLHIEVPLTALVSGFHHQELDSQNNQVLIQRVSGDMLRVTFDRNSLVFAPGETFAFHVQPHHMGIEAGALLRYHIQLVPARGDTTLWEQDLESVVSENGSTAALGPINVTIPSAEGVYDIVISVHRKKTFRDTFVRSKPVHQRRVQMIVLASEAAGSHTGAWTLVDTVDPNSASWKEWLTRVPKLPLLRDFRQEPLRKSKSATLRHLDQELVQLAPNDWQACPLPVARVGQPHLLEVEYPSDISQTLGISIVEPNSVGKVVPLGLDSGVHVRPGMLEEKPRMLRHKLFFWPRTTTPLLLLTNRHDSLPAVFGRIRVYAGPDTLPAAAADNGGPAPSARLLAAYFDKPLFPENFSASETADAETGRSLRDWVTFYESGKRLVEYLKHVGYNGAVLCVARQGSTIYPSLALTPTPKYDTGTFFSSGQDPVRKDILEMLFRLFDREGMHLVPAIQFSSTLVELEQRIRSDRSEAQGIYLTEGQGRTWRELQGTDHGMAPHYNPLDPQVQAAMRQVLNELTDRYARHTSFHGIALQLDPDAYAMLPGEPWGQDSATRRRFEQSLANDEAHQGADGRDAERSEARARNRQSAWLTWRARQMAQFHRDMLDDLTRRRADAQLLLLGGNMFTGPAVQPLLRPTLPNGPNVSEALLQLGLDADQYTDQERIVFCRPDRIAPHTPLSAQAVNINLATSSVVDSTFSRMQPAASLFYHETLPLSLPSFDAASPFGQENTRTVLFAHIAPSGDSNRQRFVHHLALRDVRCMLDGGWMLPLGQEEALQPLFDTWRRLPAESFTTVQPKASGLLSQPLVVRTLIQNNNTYIYVVNDSPWALSAEIDLHAPGAFELTALGGRPIRQPQRINGQTTWDIELQPYDLLGAVVNSNQVTVDTWRVTIDRNSYAQLRQQVNELHARATKLGRSDSLDVLTNPGFEQAADRLPGWIHAQGNGISIGPNNQEYFAGTQSLRMSSEGPVAWIRSDPFTPPKTGRIAVMVRLKIQDPAKQPPLRLAIEGRRLDGKPYYKPFNVVQNPREHLLTNDWGQKPFVMLVSDVPTSELADLRVGFDLMGQGEVWIDDVQVYDRWFPKNERDDLLIMSGLAARSLSMGQLAECQRILSGYWPRFLEEYVTLQEARVATAPANATLDSRAFPPPQPKSEEPQDEKSSVLDKVKQRLPNRVLPFKLR
ncbi:MAG: family 10 glycosylhydrolase [Pirellulaceae bacterium]